VQLLNTQVFDEAAIGWGSAIDRSIQRGRYLRGELFVAAVRDHIPPNGFILDYGCGPGRISVMLARAGYRVLAVDPSPVMIATAKQKVVERLDLEFRVCKMRIGDLPERPCDGIVCSSVIEYIAEPEELLRCFAAALGASSPLIISFANSRSIWGAWSRLSRTSGFSSARKHTWSWSQFRSLLERSGFATENPPIYFESPLDRLKNCPPVLNLPFGGTLGLVVARTCDRGSR